MIAGWKEIVTVEAGTSLVLATPVNPMQAVWPAWLTGGVMWGFVIGVLVLSFVGWVLMNRQPAVRPLSQAGRVVGVVGRMGSGKSYFAVRMAYEQLKAGAHVATNFEFHLRHGRKCDADCQQTVLANAGSWRVFRDLDDLAEIHGDFEWRRGRRVCVRRFVVIVDEAQDLSARTRSPHQLHGSF